MASRNIVLKIQFVISFAVVFGLLIRIFDFLSIVNPWLENLIILEYFKKTCNNGPVLFIITRLQYLDSLCGCLRSSGTGNETAVLSKIDEL